MCLRTFKRRIHARIFDDVAGSQYSFLNYLQVAIVLNCIEAVENLFKRFIWAINIMFQLVQKISNGNAEPDDYGRSMDI